MLRQWPKGGPKLLWAATGCGQGFSSVTIADGLIYTAGVFDKQTLVLAYDLGGKLKWKSPNGKPWSPRPQEAKWARSQYNGSRATPTIDDGMAYHLDALGRLAAYDAKAGKEAWALNVADRFKAKHPTWGYSEHVLTDGSKLICYPGGSKGYMVALDKKTGKTVWANTTIGDRAANASPILVEDKGVRQIITMSSVAVIGVDADTGKLLWRHPHVNRYKETCDTPIYRNGVVYVTSGYRYGSEAIKLTFAGGKVTVSRMWLARRADGLHGGQILHKGYIYGVGYDHRGWYCLDAKTGQVKYRTRNVSRGCLAFADGMLYCLDTRGRMSLVQPSPEGFKLASRFQVPRGGKGFFFAHPVICGGRLYVRHADRVYAYDLRAD